MDRLTGGVPSPLPCAGLDVGAADADAPGDVVSAQNQPIAATLWSNELEEKLVS